MPRMGLTTDKVVTAAAALADQVGIDALSLSTLAANLGVRVPSLYKHIGRLDDVRRRLAAQGAVGLAAAVEAAVRGEHGRDALLAVGGAYRATRGPITADTRRWLARQPPMPAAADRSISRCGGSRSSTGWHRTTRLGRRTRCAARCTDS